MIEKIEFLIDQEDAVDMRFPTNVGRMSGLFWFVTASPGTELFEQVRQCEERWTAERRVGHFAKTSRFRRCYTKTELERAELFRLLSRGLDTEAASDRVVYDFSSACPHCGAGRKQISELIIDETRLPRRKDVAYTIGKEWLVRKGLADAIINQGFTGMRFRPIVHRRRRSDLPLRLEDYPTGRKILERCGGRGGVPIAGPEYYFPDLWPQLEAEHQETIRRAESLSPQRRSMTWLQLEAASLPAHTCPPTAFGITCFDRDVKGQYRCPLGHTSGFCLLSEVFIKRGDWDGSDLVATADLYGQRAGFFVPQPALLISPRLYRFLIQYDAKGIDFEVAHLV